VQTKGITKEKFAGLSRALSAAGRRVVAPVRKNGLVLFKSLEGNDEICLEEINPRLSIKEFFFPGTEPLLTYSWSEGNTTVSNARPESQKTVILGCRGCDASSLPAMDALFNWEYRDDFYMKRRENTTVISIACNRCDECCFCTSVGGGPHNTGGSDIMLSATGDGGYLAEIITEKGAALADELSSHFTKDADKPLPYADVQVKFDLEKVRPELQEHFESPLWDEFSYKCLACGCCTYVCPNCHCFDIQDEHTRTGGTRIRVWDGCQFPLFTKHTSGHNPRPTQGSRWRQRIQHKFNYYVEKFDRVSCVGCGRCIRHCPVNMNISEHLARIANGDL